LRFVTETEQCKILNVVSSKTPLFKGTCGQLPNKHHSDLSSVKSNVNSQAKWRPDWKWICECVVLAIFLCGSRLASDIFDAGVTPVNYSKLYACGIRAKVPFSIDLRVG